MRYTVTTQIYSNCPVFENNYFMLRQTIMADKADLFKVYSDKKAVPFSTRSQVFQGF